MKKVDKQNDHDGFNMDILLTLMFAWNRLGALILVPALSHFLLQGESLRFQRAPQNNSNVNAVAEGAV